jgi:hypothetical protein
MYTLIHRPHFAKGAQLTSSIYLSTVTFEVIQLIQRGWAIFTLGQFWSVFRLKRLQIESCEPQKALSYTHTASFKPLCVQIGLGFRLKMTLGLKCARPSYFIITCLKPSPLI